MYEEPEELIIAFGATPDALATILAGIDGDAVSRPGPHEDDDWPIARIVEHLVFTERLHGGRMRRLRDEDEPWLPAAQDEGAAATPTLSASLATFAAERAALVAWLGSLGASDWSRAGTHEEGGAVSLRDIADHLARHDLEHLGQLSRRVAALQS
jgi:hypothetical protein